jgi:hypothetical protein
MRRWAFVAALAVSGCQWIAGTESPLPRAASTDAGLQASEASADAIGSGVPFVDEALSDRPVALYRFVGVADGLCADSSGSGHDVRLTCTYNYPRPPIVVKSSEPTMGLAADDPVRCTFPLDASLDLTNGDFTYEMWTTGGDVLLSSRDDQGNGPGIEVRVTTSPPETTLAVTYTRHGSSGLLSSATAALAADPRHVVVSSAGGVPTLWVNGIKGPGMRVGSEALPRASVRIGDAEGDYGSIVVYDHALPEDRVLAHWRAGSGN